MERWCSVVVFDMAGTTVRDEDNAVASAVQRALAESGCAIDLVDVNPVMGMPKPLAIGELLKAFGAPEDATPANIERTHERFQEIIVAHYRDAAHVEEMPGASELFRTLCEHGIKVTLDTGFDRRTLDTIVERLGWAELLDATVASDEVAHGRPAPDMIKVLMERTGVNDPSCVCKIGDSVSDLEQGVSAGCGLVVAMRCERTRDVYGSYEGVVAIDRLEELLPYLGIEYAGAER